MPNLEVLNGSLEESVAGTLKSQQVEVPNSGGAKGVTLIFADIICANPALVASTATAVGALILAGAQSPTTIDLSETGALHSKKKFFWSDATPDLIDQVFQGDYCMQVPINIPKNADGKYYVTVAVKGDNNAVVKKMHYHMRFAVAR